MSRLPVNQPPIPVGHGAVADQQGDEAVEIGGRRLCLGVGGRRGVAVINVHRDLHVLVGHQLVLGVAHHSLVTDFVVLREDRGRAA